MIRAIRVAIAATALALLTANVAAQEFGGTLVVANRVGGSISLFDLPTGVEAARIPVGPRIPHEVAVSADGRLALTGAYGSGANPGRHLLVIDIASASLVGRIDLGPDARPHSVAFLPDSRRAVATMEVNDQLALVDVEELRVLRVFPTGGREGHMVRVNAAGTRAYVASRGAEGTLSVIDLEQDRPPTVIPTGAGAEGLAVAPSGDIWVVNRAAGSISIVDGDSLQVSATVTARMGAGRAEISPQGRVLVPNGSGAQAVAKYLTVYDESNHRVVAEQVMNGGEPATGAYSIHVVGEYAFVADRTAMSIDLYDLATLMPLQTLATSHDGPDGMAYSRIRIAAMQE